MKKLVIALAIMAMAAIAQEAFKFPGWACRDVELLNQQLTLATDNWQKIMILCPLDLAKNGEPATFADACARIDAACDVVDVKMASASRTEIKKQFINDGIPRFRAELAVFAKENPSSYDFYLALWGTFGDEPEFVYQILATSLLKSNYSASYVTQAVGIINRQAIALGKDDAEVLDLLKKLNRVFSANLTGAENDPWGLVVSKIRTMMETYK